jgi:hypothetical protein
VDADQEKEPIMLQKQSISRNQVVYLIIAVSALALIVSVSLIHRAGYIQFSNFISGPAAVDGTLLGNPRVMQAEINRLNGLAGETLNLYGSTARINAENSTSMTVDAQRLNAVAGRLFNLHGSTAWVHAELTAAMRVQADRLNKAAGHYLNLYGSTAWVRGGLTPAQKVEAQRLQGLAGEYVNLFGTTAR